MCGLKGKYRVRILRPCAFGLPDLDLLRLVYNSMTYGFWDVTCMSACTCRDHSKVTSYSRGEIMAHKCSQITNKNYKNNTYISRNFDCLLFGDKGIKIVKPEEGYPVRPTDVEIDEDNDEIEDYDENVVRKKRNFPKRH